MNPEALDAIANKTMRPNALEAATSPDLREDTEQPDSNSSTKKDIVGAGNRVPTHTYSTQSRSSDSQPETPSTPFGQRTDGTQSAARIVEGVVHGMKAAVDVAVAWAEKKADELSSTAESTGPYTSPATCVPSDLDAIASGVLPAMPSQDKDPDEEPVRAQHDKDEKGKGGENSEEKDGEDKIYRKPP